jgi:hypothetical protein
MYECTKHIYYRQHGSSERYALLKETQIQFKMKLFGRNSKVDTDLL